MRIISTTVMIMSMMNPAITSNDSLHECGYRFERTWYRNAYRIAMDDIMSPKEQRGALVSLWDSASHMYLPVNGRYQLQVKRSKLLKDMLKRGYLRQLRLCKPTLLSDVAHYKTVLIKNQ